MVNSSKARMREVLWFLLTGLSTSALYFGLVVILSQELSLPALIAVPSSYFIAVTLHFVLNNRFTFSSPGGLRPHAIVRYAIFSLAAFLAQSTLVFFLIARIGFGLTEAVAVAAITIPIASFFTMKIWVFRKALN